MIRPLLNAVERAGGILLIPGDNPAQTPDMSDLLAKVDSLEAALERAREEKIGLQAQVDMLKSMFNDAIKNSTLQSKDHPSAPKNGDKREKAV